MDEKTIYLIQPTFRLSIPRDLLRTEQVHTDDAPGDVVLHGLCIPFHQELGAAAHKNIIASIIFCLLVKAKQRDNSESVNLKMINDLN